MPGRKSDKNRLEQDLDNDTWIQSMFKVLNLKGGKGKPADKVSAPNGSGETHLAAQAYSDKNDLAPEIKKLSSQIDAYKQRKHVFKETGEQEILENYCSKAEDFLKMAGDL
ncbi:hypothetical protein [Pseudovibrio sp. SCP19]|uniref:hypothetical protein n=1 Tax=Pseudovibrio sp. SCP19 TaxID=3141374 RepID=UPI0033358A00